MLDTETSGVEAGRRALREATAAKQQQQSKGA
jgi:hypothetical protein